MDGFEVRMYFIEILRKMNAFVISDLLGSGYLALMTNQLPTIHPKGSRFRSQTFSFMWRGYLGLHRWAYGERTILLYYHSPAARFICFLFERVLLIPESTFSTSSTRFAKHPLWLKPSRNQENLEKSMLMGYISFLFHGTSKKSSTWSSQKADKVYPILSVLNRYVCGHSSSLFIHLGTS